MQFSHQVPSTTSIALQKIAEITKLTSDQIFLDIGKDYISVLWQLP
jgi:hypothetical protein